MEANKANYKNKTIIKNIIFNLAAKHFRFYVDGDPHLYVTKIRKAINDYFSIELSLIEVCELLNEFFTGDEHLEYAKAFHRARDYIKIIKVPPDYEYEMRKERLRKYIRDKILDLAEDLAEDQLLKEDLLRHEYDEKLTLAERKSYFDIKGRTLSIGAVKGEFKNFLDIENIPQMGLLLGALFKEDRYIEYVHGEGDYSFLAYEDYIRIIEVPKKRKLCQKYKIAIDTIEDNIKGIISTILIAGVVVVSGRACVGWIHQTNLELAMEEKYKYSVLVDDGKSYPLNDIYVAYSADKVYFCTRSISKVTEADKIYGKTNWGTGETNEYYYRDKIYSYYDIKTGEKICVDHEDGFYIEKLSTFYDKHKMDEINYQVTFDEVKKEINNDYLLSRNPGERIK